MDAERLQGPFEKAISGESSGCAWGHPGLERKGWARGSLRKACHCHPTQRWVKHPCKVSCKKLLNLRPRGESSPRRGRLHFELQRRHEAQALLCLLFYYYYYFVPPAVGNSERFTEGHPPRGGRNTWKEPFPSPPGAPARRRRGMGSAEDASPGSPVTWGPSKLGLRPAPFVTRRKGTGSPPRCLVSAQKLSDHKCLRLESLLNSSYPTGDRYLPKNLAEVWMLSEKGDFFLSLGRQFEKRERKRRSCILIKISKTSSWGAPCPKRLQHFWELNTDNVHRLPDWSLEAKISAMLY